jgi:hypothetical protein
VHRHWPLLLALGHPRMLTVGVFFDHNYRLTRFGLEKRDILVRVNS